MDPVIKTKTTVAVDIRAEGGIFEASWSSSTAPPLAALTFKLEESVTVHLPSQQLRILSLFLAKLYEEIEKAEGLVQETVDDPDHRR